MTPLVSKRRSGRGFSLLEVMVAVAILGLVLTVVLSAQGGLAASNRSAANLGLSSNLGRCKMTEVEEKLLKMGYPEIDVNDTDVSCCEDLDQDGFRCDVKVEKVELPPLDKTSGDGGSPFGAPSGSGDPLGGLVNPAGDGKLNLNLDAGAGGLASVGQQIGQQFGGAGGASGLMSMVMGIVYPSLKPMLEASIRRIQVMVRWKEGPNAKEFALVQYVTQPQRSGFAADLVPDGGAFGGPAGSAIPAATGTATGAVPRAATPGGGLGR